MNSDRALAILRSCSGNVEQETLKNALGRIVRRKLLKNIAENRASFGNRAKVSILAIIAVVHE